MVGILDEGPWGRRGQNSLEEVAWEWKLTGEKMCGDATDMVEFGGDGGDLRRESNDLETGIM